ncbi:MAG: cytochrome c biogenesis protein CcsA [Candidatus Ozemobacteraceae bacterium]
MLPFIIIAGLGYGFATLFRLMEKVTARPMTLHGTASLVIGFLAHLTTLGFELHQLGETGAFRVRFVLSAVAALFVAVCMFLERRNDTWFSLFVFPPAIPLAALPLIESPGLSGPAFQGPLFWIHVSGTITGECFFLLAAVSSISYLYQTRRLKAKNRLRAVFLIPPLTRLDQSSYHFIFAGLILFTTGIISGALWSLQTYSILTFHDPKRLAALLLSIYYGSIILGRSARGWAGPRLAWMIIVGATASLAQILLFADRIHWKP